jgi:flavodoxin I
MLAINKNMYNYYMKVLIVYATNSGSTEICSKVIKETLEKSKNIVTMQRADITKQEDLTDRDLILFGSPSWDYEGKEGMPHEDMMELFKKLENFSFNKDTKYAVFGCGDRSYAYFAHAVNVMEDFLKTKGVSLTVPSLKVDAFFFDMDKNIAQVETWAAKLI